MIMARDKFNLDLYCGFQVSLLFFVLRNVCKWFFSKAFCALIRAKLYEVLFAYGKGDVSALRQ